MRPSARRTTTAPPARSPASQVPPLWSAVVGVLFGMLYAALAPTVWGGKDAGEITLALAVGGALHPTGYPLYTLAGHAFVVLLHGLGVTWPHAANLWSAVGAAVAMALFHALASRIVPPGVAAGRVGRAVLALVATALIGLHPAWLIDAIIAEVYSWHLAWVCGACLLTLALVRGLATRERGGAASSWTARRLAIAAAAWGLFCGVGLAHHATSVLFIVPLSLAIVVAAVRAQLWGWRLVSAALLAALVPLAGYGFILYRAYHPAVFQWPILQPSLPSVVAHVTGAEYRDLFGRFAPQASQGDLFRTSIFPVLFPALAALLVAVLRTRAFPERVALWGMFSAAALQTGYGLSYGVADPASYFHPNLAVGLLAVPLLGAGLLRHRRLLPAAGVLAGAGLVALGWSWLQFASGLRIGVVLIESRVHEGWRSLPDEDGIVLWRHDMVQVLRGYQLLSGERPRLFVQDPNALTWSGPRREFTARFGFDPLAGLAPLTDASPALIPENINRQTTRPVFVFGLEGVQRLAKAP